MQSMSGSFRNLAALASGDDPDLANLSAGGPLQFSESRTKNSRNSVESSRPSRYPILSKLKM